MVNQEEKNQPPVRVVVRTKGLESYLTLNNLLLLGVVIVLIIAFVLLCNEYVAPKQIISIGGLESPSILELSAITGADATASIQNY